MTVEEGMNEEFYNYLEEVENVTTNFNNIISSVTNFYRLAPRLKNQIEITDKSKGSNYPVVLNFHTYISNLIAYNLNKSEEELSELVYVLNEIRSNNSEIWDCLIFVTIPSICQNFNFKDINESYMRLLDISKKYINPDTELEMLFLDLFSSMLVSQPEYMYALTMSEGSIKEKLLNSLRFIPKFILGSEHFKKLKVDQFSYLFNERILYLLNLDKLNNDDMLYVYKNIPEYPIITREICENSKYLHYISKNSNLDKYILSIVYLKICTLRKCPQNNQDTSQASDSSIYLDSFFVAATAKNNNSTVYAINRLYNVIKNKNDFITYFEHIYNNYRTDFYKYYFTELMALNLNRNVKKELIKSFLEHLKKSYKNLSEFFEKEPYAQEVLMNISDKGETAGLRKEILEELNLNKYFSARLWKGTNASKAKGLEREKISITQFDALMSEYIHKTLKDMYKIIYEVLKINEENYEFNFNDIVIKINPYYDLCYNNESFIFNYTKTDHVSSTISRDVKEEKAKERLFKEKSFSLQYNADIYSKSIYMLVRTIILQNKALKINKSPLSPLVFQEFNSMILCSNLLKEKNSSFSNYLNENILYYAYSIYESMNKDYVSNQEVAGFDNSMYERGKIRLTQDSIARIRKHTKPIIESLLNILEDQDKKVNIFCICEKLNELCRFYPAKINVDPKYENAINWIVNRINRNNKNLKEIDLISEVKELAGDKYQKIINLIREVDQYMDQYELTEKLYFMFPCFIEFTKEESYYNNNDEYIEEEDFE